MLTRVLSALGTVIGLALGTLTVAGVVFGIATNPSECTSAARDDDVVLIQAALGVVAALVLLAATSTCAAYGVTLRRLWLRYQLLWTPGLVLFAAWALYWLLAYSC